MMTALTRMYSRTHAWVVEHPASVHWTTLVICMVLAASYPEVGAPAFVVLVGLTVAAPLLWRLLSERADNHRLRAERDELERGMKEITETLRQGVERLKTSA